MAHQHIDPPELLPPRGFTHVVVAAPGRVVHIAGQTAHRPDGTLPEGLVAQVEGAVANLAVALRAAGARPEHLVAVQIYVTDVAAYRAALGDIGRAWRRHLGGHYPAVSLFGVTELFDPAAVVEIVATAVVPEG